MKKLKNIHPGEILQEEFLIPLEISAYRLSKDIRIPQTRVSEIVKGNRRITADTHLDYLSISGIQRNFGLDFRTTSTLKKKEMRRRQNLTRSSNVLATLHNTGLAPQDKFDKL
jgi:addiction module HigA family antidote